MKPKIKMKMKSQSLPFFIFLLPLLLNDGYAVAGPTEVWHKKLNIKAVGTIAKSPQQELKEQADDIRDEHIHESKRDEKEQKKIDAFLKNEMSVTDPEAADTEEKDPKEIPAKGQEQ